MVFKSNFYKFVAVLVSLGLLLQIFIVPTAWFSSGVETAEANGHVANSDIFSDLPPDLEQELDAFGLIGTDGQPNRFLLDAEAEAAETFPTAPEALANPLSISRVQTTYQAGGTAVVTYTVTNNRLAVHFPTIPDGATITETSEIMADFDLSLDPNSIRDVMVSNNLTGPATYLDAAPLPDQQGDTFVWNLGDIPPQASASFSWELQLPGTAPDFIELDSGAAVFGTLKGRMVEAGAAPAILAPDGFAQWLIWTPDANIYDEYMLVAAAEQGQAPALLFDYVRSLSYEAYNGSMRGTRGTLWSEAGNSADQASLLIAMLRSSGIPARYRHGSLNTADAQQLIDSMFPTPNQVVGHVPAEAIISDPVNDPALIAEVQDHWWVEAYLPGSGWTDLDPSFANASIGDSFAVPAGDGSDQIAELPDEIRHKVHLSLKVEKYSDFPFSGSNLSYLYPLAATLNVVEMVGLPANVGFLVDTDVQGGLIFTSISHTYDPFISIGDAPYIWGESFSELLTSFPLATQFVTGMWLNVETETPDGETTSYEREIKDRIGPDGRLNGSVLDLEPLGNAPFISTSDVVQVQVVPQSQMPRSEVGRLLAKIASMSSDTATNQLEYNALDLDDNTEVTAWIEDNADNLRDSQLTMLEMLGTTYYAYSTASDRQPTSASMLVKSYPDAPKLLLMSQSAIAETVNFSFELLNIRERSIAYPGQSEEAEITANLIRTMGDKAIEYDLLNLMEFESVQSAYGTFSEALDTGVPLAMITDVNLEDLAALTISDEAKARITLAVQDGNIVFVPAEPVPIDGTPTIGWLEIDETGHASFVNEAGQQASFLESALQFIVMLFSVGPGAALLGGLITTIVLFFANVFGLATSLNDYATGQAVGGCCEKVRLDLYYALAGAAAEAAGACSAAGAFVADCVGGVAIAVLFIAPLIAAYSFAGDPSLPSMLLDREVVSGTPYFASRPVTLTPTSGAATIAVSAVTSHIQSNGTADFNWTDANQHGLVLSSFTANNVSLYDGGLLLDTGSAAVAGLVPASLAGNPLTVALDASGSQAAYAPTLDGLGLGTNWDSYTADLSSAQPYTLTLVDTTVTMNGTNIYTGTLTAVVTGAAQIGGPEHSPLPTFSPSTTAQMQMAAINTGPLDGTVLADGSPFPADNGLALAPHTGPVTVTESAAMADLVEFSGAADFFSLLLNPATSSVTPTQVVTITPELEANFNDTYTYTVEAPVGWTVDVAANSEVSALPPAGAAPADYTILVTAQSGKHPDLFVSAVHTVTVLAYDGLNLAIQEDDLFTIPMGPVSNPSEEVIGNLGHVVNGQAEIPGAAYTIIVTNTSTTSYTFDLAVAGLPVGWTILSNAGQATATSLSLEAGQMGQVGLYVSPTVSALMSPGTNYLIDVTATAQGNPGLTQNSDILFTMPGLAFPYPQLSPDHQYVTEGDPLSFDFSVTNVGNVAGTFPLTATVRKSFISGLTLEPSPVTSGPTWTTPSLAPMATDNETVAITTTGLVPNQTYLLTVASQQSEYNPTAFAAFTVASQTAGPIFEASDETADFCTLGEPGLSAALRNLGTAVSDLEASCDAGSCSLFVRDNVVTALESVVYYSNVSPLITADSTLATIATDLAGHTSNVDIEADLAAISATVPQLTAEVCEVSQHIPEVRWQPAYDASLVGQPVSYTLDVTNQGTVTTTYAVTVSLPSATMTFTTNLTPGETDSSVYPISGGSIGVVDFSATARAIAPDVLFDGFVDGAEAALNVVDRFVQVTAVTADPPFVETGTSTTTLSVDINNVANVPRPSTAETTILAPGGGISYTADISLTILTGSTTGYELAAVDTSGWAEGVYTITVNLLDGNDDLIPDGSGFGNFAVGQGLGVTHGVQPQIVAPGTTTVTTIITSEVLVSVFPSETLASDIYWPETGLRFVETVEEAGVEGETAVSSEVAETAESLPSEDQPPVTVDMPLNPLEARSVITQGTVIVRYEEDEPGMSYSGSWTAFGNSTASSGSHRRSNSANDTVSFDFDGTWVGLGFLALENGGKAEIFIDGVSQGVVDLFHHDQTAVSFYYDGLISATHTVSVTVLGSSHPNSTNSYVRFDYVDTWDGTVMPDGTFEQDDPRVLLSGGWNTFSNAVASDGTYARDTAATAWFPFSGDTISYRSFAYPNAGKVKVYIDGQFQTIFDLYSPTVVSRTLSFEDLGPGPHMMQISAYRGIATIDSFTTPGSGPFYEPITPTGVIRYEEDDPVLRFNGDPLTQTVNSWSIVSNGYASDGYFLRSNTPGDTAELTFNGSWVGVGFASGTASGEAEIFIDGLSQGIVDLYRHDNQQVSLYFDDLITATHTISVVVTGGQNPNSSNNRVNIDFFDTWDGTTLPDGTFEAELGNYERLFLSTGFADFSQAAASNGTYLRDSGATAWFPFTGDTVSYRALAYSNAGTVKIFIDGQFQTSLDLYSPNVVSRTLSFENLGAGPHVIQISTYRGVGSVDTFTTPGSGPFYDPTAPTGVVRYEEDDPVLRYNGMPFTQRGSSWDEVGVARASHGIVGRSNNLSDTVTLTFDGSWVGLGLLTGSNSGIAQISMDGVVLTTTDLYSPTGDVLELFYDGLITGTHTITVTVLDQQNINSSNSYVHIDFFDFWDGATMAPGWYEADPTYIDNKRVDMSTDWSDINDSGAREDIYYQNGSSAWFRFTGDSVTYLAFSDQNIASSVEIFIDGVSQGILDLTYDFTHSPLPFHFTGLGAGPHVLYVRGIDRAAVDAFEANPTNFHPGVPMVEWYDTAPDGGEGVIATAAAGDVNRDGDVEIAAISDSGDLYLFAGDGTGLLWSQPVGSEPEAPVLADLDGSPGAEIIVGSQSGIYAFHADGTQFWFTNTIQTEFPAGGSAVGNLDDDNAPEIVVAGASEIAVLEADGSLAWQNGHGGNLSPPVLADLTGDGYLDILVLQDNDDTAYLYNYNQGITPTLEWSHTFTSSLNNLRGAPAVANIDGQQPGGDSGPEVVIATNGFVNVLDADGSLLWSTPIGAGVPGGVSIADTDGDGEVEIITSAQFNGGRIYVLNADGSILWDGPALDGTSGTSAVTHDLDGDGSWEVIWNGDGQGLTIYDGSDGTILFNEPIINSITRKDFPIVVDVDGDGHGEIVAGDRDGLYIIGYDNVWADSRDLWNQYNYHVTNVNDDLTIPPTEPNSWQIHNTYRTQTPLNEILAVYGVDVTHTVGISGVTLLTGTLPLPNDIADPNYHWSYTQYWYQTVYTSAVDLVVEDMAPGEVQAVSQGTEVVYTLPSGENVLMLPPLYVSAAHIIALTPVSRTVGSGGTAVYDVILSNPATSAATYTLTLSGLPADWVTLPLTAEVGAMTSVTVPLSVEVPAGASPDSRPFNVFADTGSGLDLAGGQLIIVDALDVAIEPVSQTAEAGTAVTYTLVVSNYLDSAQSYGLTATSTADVMLPPTVLVPAASTISLPVTVTAPANGAFPFTIDASNASGADGDTAVLIANGSRAVSVDLAPASALGGPESLTVYTVTVSNLGSVPDSYDLDVTLPVGWRSQIKVNGVETNSLSLTPEIFNTADLLLLVTPPAGETPDSYDFTVSATSQSVPGINDTVTGTLLLQNRGVAISLTPTSTTMLPTDSGLWQVTVTNTGTVADSYWLTMTGFIGPFGDFSTNPVALNAGQSTTVQLTAENLDFMVPGTFPFSVGVESQNDVQIHNEASATVTFESYEGVDVGWIPVTQTVTDTLSATYLLVITNTGNLLTTYDLGLTLPAGLTGQLSIDQILVPAHITTQFLVDVVADGPGTYLFDATADSTSTAVSDSSTATLEVIFTNLPPSADAGNDQIVDEGQLVNFNGTANDPEGQLDAVRWEFGDGNSTTGTLTPTHTYIDDGTFLVTLVVTDISGLSASDSLTMTVNNLAPTVEAGSNQTAEEGDTVSLDPASYTDPGTADTHTATIDWGDGTVEAGAVNQAANTVNGSHVYDDNGSYTVTVTVTDDDSGSNSDTLTVNVSNVAPTVEAGSNQMVDEGDTVSLVPATFTDPGTADTHTATIDWGDGTVEAGTVNQAANTVDGSHIYADDGNYTVTVMVMDDDGESNSDTFNMTVNNVAPTVEAGNNQNVNQGDTVSLDPATFTDPGTADTHTAMIDWGDGTVEAGKVNQAANTVSGSHSYTENGDYTVTITIMDDDGGSNSDTFTVTVVGPEIYYLYMPAIHRP